jgi:hypothetical protein
MATSSFPGLVAAACALTLLLPLTASDDSVVPQRTAAATTNPFAQHALPLSERRWLRGTVDTRLRAGSYVYLRMREENGDAAWLVSLVATTPEQANVRALVLGQAEHFHSPRLNRSFDPLLFAAVRAD